MALVCDRDNLKMLTRLRLTDGAFTAKETFMLSIELSVASLDINTALQGGIEGDNRNSSI